MDRSFSPRRFWPALLLLPLLLAGGHMLLWRWMGGQIESSFAAWADARRAQGWVVAHGTPIRGGWPFAATLRLPAIRVQGGAATVPGGVIWSAEAMTLRVVLPRLGDLEVEAEGVQRLTLGEAAFPFTADRMVATLALEPGVPPHEGRFSADRLRVGLPSGTLDVRSVTGRMDTKASATEAEPALTLAFDARDMGLPMAGPLGSAVEYLRAEFAVTGPVPGGRVPAQRAEVWRDAGGTLELRELALRWGPMDVEAAATMALDEGLQPMGAGTLQVMGAGEALSALAAAGAIGSRAAVTAQAAVAFLARSGADGASRVELPLTIENRTLAVARIPLSRLPVVVWPSATP
ncbi:hypothetical protein C8P66_10998 [Humitalea rosea]|uniref:DUF2125 domain-containing protein n=1 Tax=Humitalea rosea TaxID=990373 RepID=A0A2W7ILL0_9PROT|nr:DUF2125 domain-containing protein [Humitalea rosea]PZW46601.1 hypothetical protein C8P66_10998 [Humitalea rosea]